LFGQETLIKTFLQLKQPSIKQELPVKKKTLSIATFIFIILLPAVAGIQLINLGKANPNPFGPPEIVSEEGSPDYETKPPNVSIISPTNGTSYSLSSLSLTFNVSIGDSSTASVRFMWEITCEADWLLNNITVYEFNADKDLYTTEPTITQFSKTLNLTEIPEGTHSVVVHARERGAYERHDYVSGFITKTYVTNFFIDGSSSIVFTVDLKPPKISVLSVENKTYYTSEVPLTVATDELLSQIAYSIDGHENVTTVGNTTLTGLAIGEHNVTVYASDLAGNIGASKTIYFNIDVPEPFPTVLVATASAASVTIIGIGLLVYFRRRSHRAEKRLVKKP
jgi:hypothetical protein